MSLSSSRGSFSLSSEPDSISFSTFPINISNRSSSSGSSLNSYSDASLSSAPSTPPPTTPPCSSNWNLHPAPDLGGRRRMMMRRNSSLSSVASSVCEEELDRDIEWTEEEEEKIKRTYDTYLARAAATEAPFNGSLPSNITSVIARAVATSGENRVRTRSSTRSRRGSSSAEAMSEEETVTVPKWRHGMKSTRAKIIALSKESQEPGIEDTPRQGDSDATPRRRKPIVRNNSMDFVPDIRNGSIIARLGSKLQSSGAPPTSSHPYAHPTRGRLHRINSLCGLPSIAGSPTQPIPSTSSTISSQLPTSISSTRMGRTNSDYSGNRESSNFDSRSDSLGQSLLPNSSSAQNSLYNLSFDPTPKKVIVSGLGSAFSTPTIRGAYPSPVSNPRRSEISSKALGLSGGEVFGEELLNPLKRSNTFGDGFLAGAEEGQAGRGGLRGKFYLHGGDNDFASSSGSLSSFGSNNSIASSASTISQSDSTSAFLFQQSTTSTSMSLSTPSTSSSTSTSAFSLNDLSLNTKNADEEKFEDGSGYLDENYLKAGMEAREMRERFSGWAGWNTDC